MQRSIIEHLDIIDFAKNSKVFDIDIFDVDKYGIVKVYGNEGQPALFLKEVEIFDKATLKTIAEIQHLCWNFQKVLFLYVYSKTEIRIYNCSEKPFSYTIEHSQNNFKKELERLELLSCKETDTSKLKTLNTLFSRIAIDTGFIWSASEAEEIRDKLNLQNRVDRYLVKSLTNVSKKLEEEGLNDKDIIHKLVMRSLFLLYLEDKGATTKDFYKDFSENAETYFDILKNTDATYNLYKRLANDFNGSLFAITEKEKRIVTTKHLELIKKCFTAGYENDNQVLLYPNWRLFDFKIIRIELLSEIYENFLSELDRKGKKDSGTFYTPPSLVELILNEKLPLKNNESDYNVKTLDPSCGSGIFLVQTFKRLVKRYEKKHKNKLTDFTVLVEILKNNIFGIEIDEKSIKVAAFSLYLSLLDNLDPRTGWWNGKIQFPYLINDPEDKTLPKQGNNLFRRDTISNFEIEELQDFKLIVGNPPFGELLSPKKDIDNKQKSIRDYCIKEKFAKEMVLPFLHKATTLAPQGEIALIFNTKILTNTGGTYQNFRKWLFKGNDVEKIYNFSILRDIPEEFGGQLFGSAKTPVSIIFYQKHKPKNLKETITYYAPKTYIKNNVLEGIVIDATDEKHLPRLECEKPDTKIWKIAMWGSYFDFEFIEKFDNKYSSFEKYFKQNNILLKTGLNSDSEHPDFIPSRIIKAKKISRYYTLNNSSNVIENQSKYYRKIDPELFKPPFVIIKRFQKEKELVASYIDYESYCTTTGIVINGNFKDSLKKNIVGLINSKFSEYYLFMITSSWGIEREQINSDEFDQLPFIFNKNNKIADILTKIISIKNSNEVIQDTLDLEKEIDSIIYNDILKLSKDEQIIINDTLNYGLDLFEKQEKSDAVKHVVKINDYYNRLSKELNEWLGDVSLKASVTHYKIDVNCPLYMLKISFGEEFKKPILSKENIYEELKYLDRKLLNEEVPGLYFRKKLNYYDDNDVYIIKPNQRRFWSQTAAMEDCKELLIELGND